MVMFADLAKWLYIERGSISVVGDGYGQTQEIDLDSETQVAVYAQWHQDD